MRWQRTAMTAVLGLSLAVSASAPVAAATAVRLRITTAPISFGEVAVGQTSEWRVLYATNKSAVALQFRRVIVDPNGAGSIGFDLSGMSGACTDFIVQPGQTCGLLRINVTPNAAGAFTMPMTSDFTDGGTTVSVTSNAKVKAV